MCHRSAGGRRRVSSGGWRPTHRQESSFCCVMTTLQTSLLSSKDLGGVFRVRLALGREFPAAPPRAFFLTRIFHPNVGRGGERDWRPELGLEHALLALRCLLIAPNADSALNADAAALLRARYDDYFARAKLLTDIHARPKPTANAQDDNTTTIASGAGEPTVSAEPTEGEETGEGAEGGRAKRERRPRDSHKPAPARDKRRILKRL
ncbi:hypothetical protein MSG28_003207 [Choristoneura fumiferana]|uniref:Uncharacterized protein n=1 Tax=Choristoneura fumiferana TaxID=7141 RepID=A0ACC0KEN1_CHOFU|nr:hypothetical protein MSG28_003207 [Choristoneura fumiferana]